MDLKDVIEDVRVKAIEAHNAFHAGHGDVAENYLGEISVAIDAYFIKPTTPAGDVTESATSEKPAETQTEKPAEVPGAQVRPAAVVPEKLAQQADNVPESQKQTR